MQKGKPAALKLFACGTLLACAAGAMLVPKRACAAGEAVMNRFKDAVVNAYENYETEVDVKRFGLYDSKDGKKISAAMAEVVNETPYIFYAGLQFSKRVVVDTSRINRIILTYSSDYTKADGSVDVAKIKRTRARLDKATARALKSINSGMSDVEKALALHDYLVRNTEYDNKKGGSQSRLNETGALIKKKANCQGYSLAYGLLCGLAGINVDYITSKSMNHMWNLIKVDGLWYNVDVTWDDPVGGLNRDMYGYVGHRHFMKSAKSLRKGEYYGFKAKRASDESYDDMYWNGVTSSFYCRGGRWLYLSDRGIVMRDSLVGGGADLIYAARSASSFSKFNRNKYYFISNNRIYIYSVPSGRARTVWKTSAHYPESYFLKEMKYKNGKIYYRASNGIRGASGSFMVGGSGLAAAGR